AEANGALEAVIVRPALCYGARDRHFLPRLWIDMLSGRVHLVGFGWGRFLACHVDGLTDVVLRCAEVPAAAGKTFHAMDRDTGATWGQLLRGVGRKKSPPWPMLPVP